MALFNVGRAIGGFAKRGLEHNDEARKNLQDMVKASVATLTTDAIEQRKARKTIKSNYVKTANNLKALKLSGAQIEAAYAAHGDDAFNQVRSLVASEAAAYEADQQKNHKKPLSWTSEQTLKFVNDQFSIPENAVNRSIAEQAASYADQTAPMVAPDFNQLASTIGASSQEISFGGGKSRNAKMANQMQGMFQSGAGGEQTASNAAPFNAAGGSMNITPSAAEVMAMRQGDAQVLSAESNATTDAARASVAFGMAEFGLKDLKAGVNTKTFNLEEARKAAPFKLSIMEKQLEKLGYDTVQAFVQADNAEANEAMNFALKGLQIDSATLANNMAELKLSVEPDRLAKTMETLDLQIEGYTQDNIIKGVQAENADAMAALDFALKGLNIEGAKLRNEAGVNTNSLHELNQEKLEKSIDLIDASIQDKRSPATYQAHLLQIETAINSLDPNDADYQDKLTELNASRERAKIGLDMYVAATAKTTGGPKFNSLVSSHSKALENKIAAAGLDSRNLFFPEDGGTPQWKGSQAARSKFDQVLNAHNAQYFVAIDKYADGPEALQALGISAPDMYPTEEIEDEAAGVTVQPKQPDLSMVGQVYKMPDGRIGQITPKVNGRFGVNFL
jgi:hypothetical protein